MANAETAAAAVADIPALMRPLGERARAAARTLAQAAPEQKATALAAAAQALMDRAPAILEANARDMAGAQARGLSGAMLDRLFLDDRRIAAMARGIDDVRALPDPIGTVLAEWTRPNGLRIQRVRVPLGVIGIIYESRPNVTADAGALCLKSGNAVILRGGSESFHSSTAIHACLAAGLAAAGLPAAAIQMVPTADREAVGYLLREMQAYLDVVVPRGGKSLIARVQADARVPVIGHLEGLCHTYVHASADVAMAVALAVNAKMRRTGVCGATETLLIDRAALPTHWPAIADALLAAGCELRGDAELVRLDPRVKPATEADWRTEYLDAILACRVVGGLDEAIAHIESYGSGHTECIVAGDQAAADRFLHDLDSAILLHNASTQFADGGEFGMGAEIGIATGRIHARGPVGAEQLTSYKYVVHGSGQTRP
ncbi:MAG: glutamate-5-semialdehyde dehydrogenase [Chromatiales bacterium]|jgi:glutamate-5-semialdehyde dehydrogenase|nr:glutamate-5-semialdehyde dehydrogenase [Chromatiales bacterium]